MYLKLRRGLSYEGMEPEGKANHQRSQAPKHRALQDQSEFFNGYAFSEN
jgi:hypothetical protein